MDAEKPEVPHVNFDDPQFVTRAGLLNMAWTSLNDLSLVLEDLRLPELSQDAKDLRDHVFCILRNNRNPKYGGRITWTGGPSHVCISTPSLESTP